MTPLTKNESESELAHREGDGLEVLLLWCRRDGRLRVVVDDHRHGERFELPVPPASALDVFDHPFAYASSVDVRWHADLAPTAPELHETGLQLAVATEQGGSQ